MRKHAKHMTAPKKNRVEFTPTISDAPYVWMHRSEREELDGVPHIRKTIDALTIKEAEQLRDDLTQQIDKLRGRKRRSSFS